MKARILVIEDEAAASRKGWLSTAAGAEALRDSGNLSDSKSRPVQ